ncbi:glycosyltransferase family 9 protein [Brevibacterium daeguense]|uniref:Glycosyltransferase family 9 protein n=1 Tax=Brevibacterium daeguense TaxID=909936 RepID=A0ABP8EKG6_9MICO|nr:glycosyltransferase family 9 protein [Brevibacterium daeguense]
MDRPTVLALRALKLGDLLVAVPALRGLRAGFPDHRLVLACAEWLRPLVDLIGGIDELLPTPGLDDPLGMPPGVADVVVNLHGSGAESRDRLEALEAPRRIGHMAPGWDGPEWRDDIHERERWVRLINAHGVTGDALDYRLDPPDVDVSGFGAGPGSAIVHVGAFYASRHWPVDRFAAVVEDLVRRGKRVLLTGDKRERERAEQVAALVGEEFRGDGRVCNIAGTMSLTEFFAVIAGADIVVSADTGAAHLASAFGRPSVVLFGPAEPLHWGPPPGPHRVLTDESLRRGDVFADSPDPALLAVGVADVVREVDGLLR